MENINCREIMTREQKELLYKIAKLYSDNFYLEMKDHWDSYDYNNIHRIHEKCDKLEKEYKEKYGELPEWKYINDVWNAIKQLKEELNDE